MKEHEGAVGCLIMFLLFITAITVAVILDKLLSNWFADFPDWLGFVMFLVLLGTSIYLLIAFESASYLRGVENGKWQARIALKEEKENSAEEKKTSFGDGFFEGFEAGYASGYVDGGDGDEFDMEDSKWWAANSFEDEDKFSKELRAEISEHIEERKKSLQQP